MSDLGAPIPSQVRTVASVFIGAPYWWGAGSPAGAFDLSGELVKGVDCSGLTQLVAVCCGYMSRSDTDRNAASLEAACVPVDSVDLVEPGDWVTYGSDSATHIGVVVEGPDSDGRVLFLNAAQGSSNTYGDDPTAYVREEYHDYRSDFRGFWRYPSSAKADDKAFALVAIVLALGMRELVADHDTFSAFLGEFTAYPGFAELAEGGLIDWASAFVSDVVDELVEGDILGAAEVVAEEAAEVVDSTTESLQQYASDAWDSAVEAWDDFWSDDEDS